MRLGTIALLLGILMAQWVEQLPAIEWYGLLPFLVLAAWRVSPLWRLTLIAISGFLWAGLIASLMLQNQLPAELEGLELVLEGRISSIPIHRERVLRFDFATTIDAKPYTVRLNWYNQYEQLPRANEYWRLRVKLKRRYGFMNPGGYDYEGYLFRQGIHATGYVRRDDSNERLVSERQQNNFVLTMRQHLLHRLNETHSDLPHLGLIEALAIGHRANIDPDERILLTQTGTNHLVAISGLHIGLVAGLVYMLMKFFAGRCHRLINKVPAPIIAAWSALLAAFIYSALAGFAIPTQRALLMVGVFLFCIIMRRETSISYVLSIALIGILISQPLAVNDYGFWLSFTAVAIIVFTLQGRLKQPSKTVNTVKIQFYIALGMLPLMLVFFQQSSYVSPIANMFAVPWVSFVTVPATLIGVLTIDVWPTLSGLAIHLSNWSLAVLLSVLDGLNTPSFTLYQSLTPPSWTLIPAIAGVVWLLMPKGTPSRWLAIVLLLPILFIHKKGPEYGQVELALLDVGQGQSVFIRTRNHSLLYDTGPRFSKHFDAGRAVILPFLRSEGVRKLDMLVVSHGDKDHSGGAKSILSSTPVDRILTGANSRRWNYPGAKACADGQRWQWDGVVFEILSPVSINRTGGNNSSCVLRLSVAQQSVLIPGDIEKVTELKLLKNHGQALQSDVLIAPHHGSKTSSSWHFLKTVAPDFVLIPNGYRNRFGFPHPEVVNRYAKSGIKWYETAKNGALRLTIGTGQTIAPRSWRLQNRRFWTTQ